jgi:hypothetical protein
MMGENLPRIGIEPAEDDANGRPKKLGVKLFGSNSRA